MSDNGRPELRVDPLTGLKVAVAPGRARRPQAWLPEAEAAGSRPAPAKTLPDCPFCAGNEGKTPPETYALRPEGGPPNSGGWLLRVVPNLYPVLVPGDDGPPPDPLEHGRGEPTVFSARAATGVHEVIVHVPRHFTTMAALSTEQFSLALEGWRERLTAHADAAWVHVMVNEGARAGASLEHSHAQVYALPFVPALAARERERFTAHDTRTMGSCLLCDLLQEEVRLRERVVALDEWAVLIAPYASRTPYELQLVPRQHARSLAEADASAAALLQEGLRRLERVLGAPPPLNMWLRSAPAGAEQYHWRIDVVPRLTQLAGFELGAGIAVNVYPPERAAADLRAAEG